jgi:hypothetical protein
MLKQIPKVREQIIALERKSPGVAAGALQSRWRSGGRGGIAARRSVTLLYGLSTVFVHNETKANLGYPQLHFETLSQSVAMS